MEKNKTKIIFPIIAIMVILGITTYKIIQNHDDKLYASFYGKIKYAAKQCFLNKDCNETTTLKELYELNYLEKQYNPVTKELLDEKIKIEYNDEKIIIDGEY